MPSAPREGACRCLLLGPGDKVLETYDHPRPEEPGQKLPDRSRKENGAQQGNNVTVVVAVSVSLSLFLIL